MIHEVECDDYRDEFGHGCICEWLRACEERVRKDERDKAIYFTVDEIVKIQDEAYAAGVRGTQGSDQTTAAGEVENESHSQLRRETLTAARDAVMDIDGVVLDIDQTGEAWWIPKRDALKAINHLLAKEQT